MILKLRGGPKNREKIEVTDDTRTLRVAEPLRKGWPYQSGPFDIVQARYGHYTVLNEQLKNGTYYAIWMGWDK